MKNLRYAAGAFLKYCPFVGVVGGGWLIADAIRPRDQRIHTFAKRYLYQTERPRALRLMEGIICCIPVVNTGLGVLAFIKDILFPSRPQEERALPAFQRRAPAVALPRSKGEFRERAGQVKQLQAHVVQLKEMTEEEKEAFYVALYAKNALLAHAVEVCLHAHTEVGSFLEGMRNFVLGGNGETFLATLRHALEKKDPTPEQKAFQSFKEAYEKLEDPMGWLCHFTDSKVLLAACTLADLKMTDFLDIYKEGRRNFDAIMRSFEGHGSKDKMEKAYLECAAIHRKMREPLVLDSSYSLYDYCLKQKYLLDGEREVFQDACGKNALHPRFIRHYHQPNFAHLRGKIEKLSGSEVYRKSATAEATKDGEVKKREKQKIYQRLSEPKTQKRYQELRALIGELRDTVDLLRCGSLLLVNSSLGAFIQHLTPSQFEKTEPTESFCRHFLSYSDAEITQFIAEIREKHNWLNE